MARRAEKLSAPGCEQEVRGSIPDSPAPFVRATRESLASSEVVMYIPRMAISERSLSFMLRNSGEVLDELEERDVILQRRDGEDLYLALRSREWGIRESVGVLARI